MTLQEMEVVEYKYLHENVTTWLMETGPGEEPVLVGRWGSFWDKSEELKVQAASRWWCQKVRALVRQFAQEYLPTEHSWRDAIKMFWSQDEWKDRMWALLDELEKKFGLHSFFDTSVREGHLSDADGAIYETFPYDSVPAPLGGLGRAW